MTTYVCREPGVFAGDYVIGAGKDDDIVYPAVGSCMTVTVITDTELAYGAHVGAMTAETSPKHAATANLEAACTMLAMLMGDAKINRVLFIGSQSSSMNDNYRYNLGKALATLGVSTGGSASTFRALNTAGYNTGKPVNVWIKLKAASVDIQDTDGTWKDAFTPEPSAPKEMKSFYAKTFTAMPGLDSM